MTDVKTKASGRVGQLTKLSGCALGAITAAGEHLQKSSAAYEEGYALVTTVSMPRRSRTSSTSRSRISS